MISMFLIKLEISKSKTKKKMTSASTLFTKKFTLPLLVCMMLQLAFTSAESSSPLRGGKKEEDMNNLHDTLIVETKEVRPVRKLTGFGSHTPRCDDSYLTSRVIYAKKDSHCFKIDSAPGGGVWYLRVGPNRPDCDRARFNNSFLQNGPPNLSSQVSLSGGLATFAVPTYQDHGMSGQIEFVDMPTEGIVFDNVGTSTYEITLGMVGCIESGDPGTVPCPDAPVSPP
jgi:hypothetical protein